MKLRGEGSMYELTEGMGTQRVQTQMLLPGFHSLQTLISSVDRGDWPQLKNEQQFDILSTKPIFNGVHRYNKEQMRETMLNQESIFRHQLKELHGVYNRQKDLMIEMKSNEVLKHAGISQSTVCPSGLSLVDSSYRGASTSSTAIGYQSHCSSIGNNNQTSGGPSQSGVKKLQRRLFNLELPPDRDESEGYFLGSGTENCPSNGRNEIKVFGNHNGETSGYNSRAMSSGLCFGRSNDVTNQNEPIQIDKVFAYTNEYKGVWPFAKKFPENPQPVKGGEFSNLNSKNESNVRAWLAKDPKAEKTSSFAGGFGLREYKMPWESSETEARKACEAAKMTNFGIELSERDIDLSAKASQSDVTISNLVANWTKPPSSLNQNRTSVQGNSLFNTSTQSNMTSMMLQQRPEVIKDRLLVDCNSVASTPSLNSEVSHHNGGVCFRTNLEHNELYSYIPSIRPGFPNADSIGSSASNEFSQHVPQGNCQSIGCSAEASSLNYVNDNSFLHRPRNQEATQGRLHWLEAVPLYNGQSSRESQGSSLPMKIDSFQNYSKQFVNQTDLRKGSQIPTKASFSYPHLSSNPGFLASAVDSGHSVKLGFVEGDTAHDPIPDMCREKLKGQSLVLREGLANDSADSRHQIDLNICLPEPSMETVEEDAIIAEPSMESNSNERISSSHEELKRVAAEALVVISSFQAHDMRESAVHDLHKEISPCHEVDALAVDSSLLWFADIVSYEENFEEKDGIAKVKRTITAFQYEMDLFEYMTLNLLETKVEPPCYVPPEYPKEVTLEVPKEVALTTQPQKGKKKRGRPRKDFQRDTLPVLASLSRTDVTEDLQTFKGSTREIGGRSQSGLVQKNAGMVNRGRGRKRLRTCAISTIRTVRAAVSHPQIDQQPQFEELQGLEENSAAVTGRGKRTKRPAGQRYTIY